MGVKLDDWLDLLDREYLDAFIRGGGGAVKFTLLDRDAGVHALVEEVNLRSRRRGYQTANVDAASTRLHMIQDVFFAVARQLPWPELVDGFLTRAYVESGYKVPDGDLRIQAVARAADLEQQVLKAEIRHLLQAKLLRRSDLLAKDFRWAMFGLAAGRIGVLADTVQAALIEWLRGELRLISGLKPFPIFRKVARHNARGMLASLGAWCRMAGSSGLVITIDLRRLAIARRSEVGPDTIYYTRMALVDCFEMLRQLIDDTDDLTGTLIVVIADPAFLDLDNRRGVAIYRPLKERLWPDVAIRDNPNPLSSLVAIDQPGGER